MEVTSKNLLVQTGQLSSERLTAGKRGDEFRAFVRKLEQLQTMVEGSKKDIDNDTRETQIAHAKTVEAIRMFREDINGYLDKMEEALLEECEQIKHENENAVKKLETEYREIKYDLDNIQSRISSYTKHSSDLFIRANETGLRLKHLFEDLRNDKSGVKLQTCSFTPNKILVDFLAKCRPMGSVKTTLNGEYQYMFKKNICDLVQESRGEVKVQSSSNKKDCYLTGVVALSKKTIACADWGNCSAKIINTENGEILSEVSLSAQPWDITTVGNDQLAVSLTSDKKIQFLQAGNGLFKGHVIDVGGRCRGVAYSKIVEKLVVSYDDPPKVEVMNTMGKVAQCIKKDKSGSNLFERPYYVALNKTGDSIYVSDNEKNSVTKITFDGLVLAVYKDGELRCPRGLMVCRDETILVCSSHGHCVHLISSECSRIKVILRRRDGGEFCQALCFYDNTDTLYLSSFTLSDRIRFYKFA